MIYFISCELHKPLQYYNNLFKKIRQNSNWACLGEHTYLIETNDTHIVVRDKLAECIDNVDQLFVGKVSAPAAWYGYTKEVTDWIKSKLI